MCCNLNYEKLVGWEKALKYKFNWVAFKNIVVYYKGWFNKNGV